MSQWKMVEYSCPCGERFESLERRDAIPATTTCSCGALADLEVSAAHKKTVWGQVDRGPSQERPPWALDTRKYARA